MNIIKNIIKNIAGEAVMTLREGWSWFLALTFLNLGFYIVGVMVEEPDMRFVYGVLTVTMAVASIAGYVLKMRTDNKRS